MVYQIFRGLFQNQFSLKTLGISWSSEFFGQLVAIDQNPHPGLMLKLQILLYDSVLRHKAFINEKKQNEMELWQSNH